MFDEITISRFWGKVDKSGGPQACWPWTGAKRGTGYGVFSFEGRQIGAHRISLLIATGRRDLFDVKGIQYEVPSLARHACDNPICVNPTHLSWGTPRDNTNDRSKESFAVSTAKANATKLQTGRWGGVPAVEYQPVKFSDEYLAHVDRIKRGIERSKNLNPTP